MSSRRAWAGRRFSDILSMNDQELEQFIKTIESGDLFANFCDELKIVRLIPESTQIRFLKAQLLLDPGLVVPGISAYIIPINKNLRLNILFNRLRYEIKKKTFQRLKKSMMHDNKKVSEFNDLILDLELVNGRHQLLHNIIHNAAASQKNFLLKGEPAELEVLEIKEMAKTCKVDPSCISRILPGKYIKVGTTILELKDLFVAGRQLKKIKGKTFLKEILEKHEKRMQRNSKTAPLSDQLIRLRLSKKGMDVSRRTINNWRRELEMEQTDEQ